MIPGLRTFRLGIRSLMLHKLRSGLTMLGILFGVGSVIAMLSVSEGASQTSQETIREMGSTNILLRSRKPPESQVTQQVNAMQAQEYGLSYLDADVISQTLPSVEVVVPVRETPKDIWAGDRKLLGKVFGTVPEYADIAGFTVSEGRWLTELDFRTTANVVVLSSGAAEKLFPLEDPLGERILVGKERFIVVGVLEARKKKSASSGAGSSREGLYVPLSTARSWFGQTTVKQSSGSTEIERVQLHEVQVRVREAEDVIATANVVRNMLKRNHKKEDYEVVVPLELIQKAEEQKRMWNIVLGSIAAISLIVGGIGIMNVMLATVTERTREIGIRRALGAKRHHIVNQFLVETVVISGIGGLLGVAAGMIAPGLITQLFPEARTIVKPEFAFLACGISVAVGILAGLYPALRAAHMDPVEALRHE